MGSGTKVAEISNFGAASPGVPMGAEPREKIYDTAIQIKSGEQDLPVDEGTQHHQYAQDAADKAVRAAVADSSYDVPDDVTPSELKTTPDGYESFSDFGEGDAVVAVDRNGNKVDGEIINVETDADSKPGLATQNHVKVDKVDETGDFDLKSTESLKRIVEVL